jgi:hypothetical protein
MKSARERAALSMPAGVQWVSVSRYTGDADLDRAAMRASAASKTGIPCASSVLTNGVYDGFKTGDCETL